MGLCWLNHCPSINLRSNGRRPLRVRSTSAFNVADASATKTWINTLVSDVPIADIEYSERYVHPSSRELRLGELIE